MSMIVENSVCFNCEWKNSCQKINKLREMCSSEVNITGRPIDIFNVIITKCSLKNYDRSYDSGKNRGGNRNKSRSGDKVNNENNGELYSGGMYYCLECKSMHHENSRIGKLHKKEIEVDVS